MSIYSLGIGNLTLVCKYGINHREQSCPFCELELRTKAIEDKISSVCDIKMKVDLVNEMSKKVLDEVCEIKILKGRPYKCPVCDGQGEIIIDNGTLLPVYPPKRPTKVCKSCKGDGIVWQHADK
jgi:hypothetical protein